MPTALLTDPEETGRFICAVLPMPDGSIWIAAEEHGLTRIHEKKARLFLKKDGLPDNSPLVLAHTKENLLWAGFRRNGLARISSISKAKIQVKNRTVLNALSGSRIFSLPALPDSSELFCATENGVSVFRKNRWRGFGFLDGLPAGEISALARDPDGTVVACGAEGGISLWDGKSWNPLDCPESVEHACINDVHVDRAGIIRLCTTEGILCRTPVPGQWKRVLPTQLFPEKCTEDYVTFCSETDNALLFGTRKHGLLLFRTKDKSWHLLGTADSLIPDSYISCSALLNDKTILAGTYGHGLGIIPAGSLEKLASASPVARDIDTVSENQTRGARAVYDACPASRPVESNNQETRAETQNHGKSEETESLRKGVWGITAFQRGFPRTERMRGKDNSPSPFWNLPEETESEIPPGSLPPAFRAVYAGDDWQTQGAWQGRYGRSAYVLAAMGLPHDFKGGPLCRKIKYATRMGPRRKDGDSVRYWTHRKTLKSRKSLQMPSGDSRRQSSWDDAGELYPPGLDGPDLFLNLTLPAGVHLVSLYFVNFDAINCPGGWRTSDGYRLPNRFRDYRIEVKQHAEPGPEFEAAPRLAAARVADFASGVYKRFLLRGNSAYTIRIARCGSHNTVLSAVFIDPGELVDSGSADPFCTIIAERQNAISTARSILREKPESIDPDRAIAAADALQNHGYSKNALQLAAKILNRLKTALANAPAGTRTLSLQSWQEALLRRWRNAADSASPLNNRLAKSYLALTKNNDIQQLQNLLTQCARERPLAQLGRLTAEHIAALKQKDRLSPENALNKARCLMRTQQYSEAEILLTQTAESAERGSRTHAEILKHLVFVQKYGVRKPDKAGITLAKLESSSPGRWATQQARRFLQNAP